MDDVPLRDATRRTDLRVDRTDGEALILKDAWRDQEAIVGLDDDGAEARVPLSDVVALESWRTHPGSLLLTGMVAAGVIVGYLLSGDELVEATPGG